MSRVIVTGAAGYIGGETVLKLLDAGHSVVAIDREMPPAYLLASGAKWHSASRVAGGTVPQVSGATNSGKWRW